MQPNPAVLRKWLSAVCYIMLTAELALSVIGMLPGLEYDFENRMPWCICSAILMAAALLCDCPAGSRDGSFLLIHLAASAGVLRVFFGGHGLNMTCYVLAAVILVLSAVLFLMARSRRWLKVLAGILSVLMSIPALVLLFLGIFLGNFGSVACGEFLSPTGTYKAEVVITDEGALGGNTSVTVYRTGDSIRLPFGTIKHPLGRFSTAWTDPAFLSVVWEGEDIVRLNGKIWNWREEKSQQP